MEKFELSKDNLLRLQHTIVAASVYSYYLQKNADDIKKAAYQANQAAFAIVDLINDDMDAYVPGYFDPIE